MKTKPSPSQVASFKKNGALLLKQIYNETTFTKLAQSLPVSSKPGSRIFDLSGIIGDWVLRNDGLSSLANAFSGKLLRPVRVLAFNKTPQSNWAVPWHQDRVVALKQRVNNIGFENWTLKQEIHHAEPPLELMKEMLTLRLHLDPCDSHNGPLKVIHGSHHLGRLTDNQVRTLANEHSPTVYEVEAGDVLILKTSIIHASDKASTPRQRRVLHVDFAPDTLRDDLAWALDIPEIETSQ